MFNDPIDQLFNLIFAVAESVDGMSDAEAAAELRRRTGPSAGEIIANQLKQQFPVLNERKPEEEEKSL